MGFTRDKKYKNEKYPDSGMAILTDEQVDIELKKIRERRNKTWDIKTGTWV